MSDFVDVFGLNSVQIENWLSRLDLRTDYEPTVKGRARQFSRANVIELAAIGAFVSVGISPREAVARAEIVVDDSKRPRDKSPRYIVAPADDDCRSWQTDELDCSRIEEMLSETPSRGVVIVETGKIADRVDALFEQQMAEGETNKET